jgi:hypothetical protein
MPIKGPPASRSSLKIIVQEIVLKAFSMLTCTITQLKFKSMRALIPKRMVSQPPRVKTLKLMGDSVLKQLLKL